MKYAFISYIPILYLYFIQSEKLNYLNMFLYGSAIYAVFDFTNLALFYKYSLNIAI